jgi:hypothetical protein
MAVKSALRAGRALLPKDLLVLIACKPFPTDILGLKPVGFGGVLLSTPLQAFFLHHLLNVHVQLANKMGLKKFLLEAE